MKIDFGVYDERKSVLGPRRFCASFTLHFGATTNVAAVKILICNFQLFLIAALKMIYPRAYDVFETVQHSDEFVQMFAKLGRYTFPVYVSSIEDANRIHASVVQVTKDLQELE